MDIVIPAKIGLHAVSGIAPEEKPFSISDGANVAKKVELHTMSMEFTAVCFWLRVAGGPAKAGSVRIEP